ncbi:MAG: hypothetical protein HC923_02195 [Myxococcales bacterium]|nr:hypothetical protein [Myxococcales bacterium]
MRQAFEGDDVVARSFPALGLESTIDYDEARRIAAMTTVHQPTHAVLDERTYVWDGSSNAIGVKANGAHGEFDFDSVDRLISSRVKGSEASDRDATYTYDRAGSRSSTTGTRCAGEYTSDESMNRYASTPCEQHGHSAAGELLATAATGADGLDRRFVYDHRGRLASVELHDLRLSPSPPTWRGSCVRRASLRTSSSSS